MKTEQIFLYYIHHYKRDVALSLCQIRVNLTHFLTPFTIQTISEEEDHMAPCWSCKDKSGYKNMDGWDFGWWDPFSRE